MPKPDLRIVPAGADVRTVFDRVRDSVNAQRISGALSEPEAIGARWAIDTLEAMQINANRARCEALIGCYLSEQITEDRWHQHLIYEPGLADMWEAKRG